MRRGTRGALLLGVRGIAIGSMHRSRGSVDRHALMAHAGYARCMYFAKSLWRADPPPRCPVILRMGCCANKSLLFAIVRTRGFGVRERRLTRGFVHTVGDAQYCVRARDEGVWPYT